MLATLALLATLTNIPVSALPATPQLCPVISPTGGDWTADREWILDAGGQRHSPRLRRALWLARRWRWPPPSLKVVPRSSRPEPQLLLASAREYLGTPYSWGGTGDGGYDCSGFMNKIYALNGYGIPRVSREQFKIGLKVSRLQLQMGDLLFFSTKPKGKRITHVAMYIDEDEFIHAASGKGEVTYDRLTSRYYSKRLVGARRILALPPGPYSTRRGLAPPNMIFDIPTQAPKKPPKVTVTKPLSDPQPDDGDTGQITPLEYDIVEHVEGRPSQFASSFIKGAVSRVGPRLLAEDETRVALRFGVGSMRESLGFLLVPEFSYFGHDDALRLNMAAPFQVPIGGELTTGQAFDEQWKRPQEWTKVLQSVSYGQKEGNLYIDLTRVGSGTLGHGQIMRYYTPNIASRGMPNYVLKPDNLSLAFDGVVQHGGGELFIDDIIRPQVMGTMGYIRPGVMLGSDSPLARSISVASTYAFDMNAPYELDDGGHYSRRMISAFGLDVELKPLKTEAIDWKFYLDASGLVHRGGAGLGGAFGTLLRTNISGQRLHVLRLRFESRLSGPQFIASYFDTTYRLNRTKAPVDRPGETAFTKLQLLERLEGSPSRWGAFGQLTYHYARRGSLGISYEDGGALGDLAASEDYTGRSLMVFVNLRNLYLPRSSRTVNFYFAYHLRNFTNLFPMISSRRSNEYVFGSGSIALSRYVSTSLGFRKGIDPKATGTRAAVDIVADATFHYEL